MNMNQNFGFVNPNELFAHFFSNRGGGGTFVNIGGANLFHTMQHPMAAMSSGGVQIHIQNIPSTVNRSSVTTQIVNGKKIDTITQVVNGVVRKRTVITNLK